MGPTWRDETTEWSLDEHLEHWVDAGIVSDDQAEAIRRAEASDHEAVSVPAARLSLVSEVAVYLGSLLALMGGAFIVGQTWDDLAFVARLTIGIVLAVLGFGAGAFLIGIDDAGTRRLASFMWAIGTGGVAVALANVLDLVEFDNGAWNAVVVGIPIGAIGAGLWRNLDRPLQMLTTVLGLGLVVGGLAAVVELTPWAGGLTVWAVSVAAGWFALRGRLRPDIYVLALASIGAILGASALGELNEHVGPVFASLTAAGVVVAGLRFHRTPILVIGVLGFLQSLAAVLATTFDGPLGAFGVALVGLAVVVVVLGRSMRAGTPQRGHHA